MKIGYFALAMGVMVIACAGHPDEASDSASQETALHDDGWDDDRCRPAPPGIPAALAVPDDECLTAKVRGVGVQIYRCTAGAWLNIAPEANLLNRNGRFVGNHFFGPNWQWRDGSKVRAAKVAEVNAPDSAHDIPWLLLSVVGQDGAGRLAGVLHLQRLNTAGGVAPAGNCTNGAEVRVPYAADYLFYRLDSQE
ncbi:DUF3455 domain-containing protein [Pendulispora brunnea]|uniref:DUF3455 domain-containing protein n=1 Tax=Pendulispora brunnea TaxID=2905690 RepID=A0ABZ2K664_9BACT